MLLIIIAALILLALSAVAAYYWIKLKNVQKEQAAQIAKNQQAWLDRQEELASDIRFIANSMLQGQCEITEGCMRLKVLMDHLDKDLANKTEFQTLQFYYQQTLNMPHHEAYKGLSRKEQFHQDKKRYSLEDKYREQILTEAKHITQYPFNFS